MKMIIKHKKSNKYYSKGFTIIETLVAITILMIAVAGPLVVASKGLNTALYARDQIISSYLAQESMETIKNIRDNSSSIGTAAWLNSLGVPSSCVTATLPCDISSIGSSPLQPFSGIASITYDANTGYVNNGGGSTPTIFKRYYYLTKPNDSNTVCDGSTMSECEAHVVVTWNEGTIPYDVTLESELVNNPR
jgi:type II secretory pathway pseudopilin PulG